VLAGDGKMNQTEWLTEQRPREKLLTRGANSLSDSELLSIILRTGTKGKPVHQLAKNILLHFGGFRGLLHASSHQFQTIPGLGIVRYTEFQSIIEMNRRYLYEDLTRSDILNCPGKTLSFLKAKLRDNNQEMFSAIFLDSRNFVISYEGIARGTLNFAYLYPRELLKRVIHHNAAAVIILNSQI
jgi:DNA repair protein RadC